MRIIFAGTPPFAAAHLQALLDQASAANYDIVAVYTQPDRRSGRGKKLQASAVKQVAEAAGIAVEQPLSLKDPEQQQTLAQCRADVMIVAAYGLILPQAVLDTPRLGCINIHASLLPRWRGAAPVERAIIAGDSETGITIMQMDAGLDTGAMLLKDSCSIDANETGDSLREKLISVGIPLLHKTLLCMHENTLTPQQQNDAESTYANKIDKHEALIDWEQSALAIERKIRAFTSALACHSFLADQRIRIVTATANTDKCDSDSQAPGTVAHIDKNSIEVQCADTSLRITSVQIPGAKAMPIAALLNGRPNFFSLGDQFSLAPSDQDAS